MFNTTVHFVDTKYKVNKNKRTVVCIITTINDVASKLEKYNLADDCYDPYLPDVRQYVGVAKCSPEDEWDETYGRRLAEYRAARARQIDVNRDLKKFIKGISKCIDNLYDYGLLKDPHKPQEVSK